ncbi:MAG: hypothetical protein QM770_13055 [Tepidisphaeraceae bacterium]
MNLSNALENALGTLIAAACIAGGRLFHLRVWPLVRGIRERAPKPTMDDFWTVCGLDTIWIASGTAVRFAGQPIQSGALPIWLVAASMMVALPLFFAASFLFEARLILRRVHVVVLLSLALCASAMTLVAASHVRAISAI